MKQASLNQTSYRDNDNRECTDFRGATLISATGKEIPITEQMLEQSFTALIDAWEKDHNIDKR